MGFPDFDMFFYLGCPCGEVRKQGAGEGNSNRVPNPVRVEQGQTKKTQIID
jgi:hypothetical protein